jgi:hypothetical protein
MSGLKIATKLGGRFVIIVAVLIFMFWGTIERSLTLTGPIDVEIHASEVLAERGGDI